MASFSCSACFYEHKGFFFDTSHLNGVNQGSPGSAMQRQASF
jgi:hypothetical protein